MAVLMSRVCFTGDLWSRFLLLLLVASATCSESSLHLSSEVTKAEGKPKPQQKPFPVSSCSGRGLCISCQGAGARLRDIKCINGFQAMPCWYCWFDAIVKDGLGIVTGKQC